MFDFNSIIGLCESEAVQILKSHGFGNINIVLNSHEREGCDTRLVTSVKYNDDSVTLVVSDFKLEINN